MKGNYFMQTSNVDGLWQKAGFNEKKIFEIHGNIFHLQCYECQTIFNNDTLDFKLDHDKLESHTFPTCECCQRMMRPNILLWNDNYFVQDSYNE